MNKLRWFALVGGGALAVFAAWATLHYGEGVALGRFGPYAALGLVTAVLPMIAARSKAALRRLRRRVQARRGHPSVGTVFVSRESVADRQGTLSAVADAARERTEFDSVEEVTFPEGDGLKVAHTGFHDSLVRFSEDGKLVVSGSSTKTNRLLAERAEAVGQISMTRASSNPLWRTKPVRGAPRLFVTLVVLVAVIAGPLGVATAAYDSDAYNPAEKAVLVSIDLRTDLDPGASPADARLPKAAFMVDVLAEKRVEIRWELNDTTAIRRHARDAKAIAGDVRRLLAAVRTDSPTPAQTDRMARVERRLERVERRVATTARRQLRKAKGSNESMSLFAIANRTNGSAGPFATGNRTNESVNPVATGNRTTTGERRGDRIGRSPQAIVHQP